MEKKFYDHEILRRRRMAAGLTLEALADRMGCTRQYVAICEAGVSNPTIKSLEKFGRALGFETVVDFLKED